MWGSAPGVATVLAYDAGTLSMLWCANANTGQNCNVTSTFTNSTFALPTVVNGYVYVPTAGITTSNSNCPVNPLTQTHVCSGVIQYSGH